MARRRLTCPGGSYTVDFFADGSQVLNGVIVRVEPERRLGYVWGWSYVELEIIEDRADGCRYTFVQNGLTDRGVDADEEGLPAGWHEFLERLDALLDGAPRTPEQHEARWLELKPAYRAQLDAVVRSGLSRPSPPAGTCS